jgi:hypothetical protein
MLRPWNQIEEEENPRLGQFWNFHKCNPTILALYRQYALTAKRKKRGKYSIAVITEVIRWHVDIESSGWEFKLNNNLKAYYARLLMHYEPELENFFYVRDVPGDDRWWTHQ